MSNNLFNNAYNGKRVLVTGHTGFKGERVWDSLALSLHVTTKKKM